MATNYLSDIGYTGLALPRLNVEPLDLLLTGGGGPWTRIGPLDQVVLPAEGSSLPKVAEDRAPDVGTKITRKVEIGFALKILSAFLKVFGASAGLDAKYAHATEADVCFEGVTMDSIDFVPLDEYLGTGEVNTNAKNVMLWLNDGKCVVLTNVLRSPKITMTALRKNEGEVEVNAPEIAQSVQGNVKVSAAGEGSSDVTFEAPAGQPGVAFGLQALQLNYSGNQFHTWRVIGADDRLRASDDVPHKDQTSEEPDTMNPGEDAIAEVDDAGTGDVPTPGEGG